MSDEDESLDALRAGGGEAWQALETLIGKRIADGLAGGLSLKSIDEIVEEELS